MSTLFYEPIYRDKIYVFLAKRCFVGKIIYLFLFLYTCPLFSLTTKIPSACSCYDKLLIEPDAGAHKFIFDKGEPLINQVFEVNSESAPVIVFYVMNKLNCPNIKWVQGEVDCYDFGQIMKNRVCYFNTKCGYFYITKDAVDGGYVVFNRWD